MKVTVIFTCFNRKEKSVKCIKSLVDKNPKIDFRFIVVDDNSSDGTKEAIKTLNCKVDVIVGNGSLYWAGGMRKGIEKYLYEYIDSDYALLVNDDVEFYDHMVEKLIFESQHKDNAVIVGATCNYEGNYTYGALQLIVPRERNLFRKILPSKKNIECDSFNCNCVLIKNEIIQKIGNFDAMYIHSLADLDYGLRLRRWGVHIYSSEEFVGKCNKNSVIGTWLDNTLPRKERLKKKESPKGAPFKEWFYFMKKNFGIREAIKYSISPYLRIILRK